MGEKSFKLLKKLPQNIDPTFLQFIGSGNQGEVYRIDRDRCIKLYKKRRYFQRELANLKRGKLNPLFPKVYEWGNYYVIREFVNGITLSSYLLNGSPLTTNLTNKLVSMLEVLKRLGFKRLDIRISHIFIQPGGELKIIDPTNLMKHSRSYPRKLLSGLDLHSVKETFLAKVKESRPDIYHQWRK